MSKTRRKASGSDSVEALLVGAHERERTRIAKALHDDIGQRAAVLTMDLDRLEKALPLPVNEVTERVRALSERSLELSRDIQALSHQLYPARLEFLGIVSAASAFCDETSKRQHVEVAFVHDSVPPDLSIAAAVILFRVLQEAIANAVSHSRARRIDVALRGETDAIRIEIVDAGIGFDPDAIEARGAPGIVGMRERARSLGGEFAVRSSPGRGTAISVRLPLPAADRPRAPRT